ncbi:hypothetical protein [Granulicoccus sp. GXG6511]|uniref:hypothetical protein n=1 Tax=Granulicoccus sp. GXG6511 TaxID=3381351 RepID=UPI003D7D682F
MINNPASRRSLFLLPCGAALLLGLDAGLLLLGLPAPLTLERLPDVHGMLMAIGFVGALIALERAVARGGGWAYAAPLGMAVGALLTLSPAPLWLGAVLMLLGATVLLVTYRPLWNRNHDPAVAIQALGAFLAVGACALWARGVAMPMVVPWLTGFFVLTIAGERVELARVGQLFDAKEVRARREDQALGLSMILVMVIALATMAPQWGLPTFGALLVLVAVLFGWRDVARKTIRSTGLPRFSAAGLLAAYFWLAVAGLLWLRPAMEGFRYDAVLHATFLGFVMSMVLAHAPVILPAVIRRPLPYGPAFWMVLVVLHGSLLVRVGADLLAVERVRAVAGVLNIVALLALVATALISVLTAKPPATPDQAELRLTGKA